MKLNILYTATFFIFISIGIYISDYQLQDHLDQKIETYGGSFYALTTKYGNDVIIRDGGTIYHIDSIKCLRAKEVTDQYKLYQKLKNKKCN